MRIIIDTNKTIDQNASRYFEAAKKARAKAERAKKALEKTAQDLIKLEKHRSSESREETAVKKIRKALWYEKFRWFRTSDDRLVIGGRDATTNDMVIKKYTEDHDLIFHTDMAGSPFFVLKTEGKPVPKQIVREVADATCSFSRAFKLGYNEQSVFYASPDQVTKKAQSGEYLQKGAFMIRGKTEYTGNSINVAIGLTKDQELMCGPKEAIKKHCTDYLIIEQGDRKVSDVAKEIKKKIKGAGLDDIIRVLPTGTMKIRK
jgi:predicted ribosome quality control (RQC) complex YloA/Tae2 family protein